MPDIIVCTARTVPDHLMLSSALRAISINPVNRAPMEVLSRFLPDSMSHEYRLAVSTTKYWHGAGVKLTVGFLDNPPADLRQRIIAHMNAWSKTANVQFTESSSGPQVRIARAAGQQDGGYWSYIGTEVLDITQDQPTMNLEGFTMNTPDEVFTRTVRHETGHTLGFVHEHMRKELVDKIDKQAAYRYYEQKFGWAAAEVDQQVLTPLADTSILGTEHADPDSVMCYQIPASLTKDHQPILGGKDISAQDYAFAAKVYPKPE